LKLNKNFFLVLALFLLLFSASSALLPCKKKFLAVERSKDYLKQFWQSMQATKARSRLRTVNIKYFNFLL